MVRHVGIYSGTFDPIHQGHIAFAKETMQICNLDEVVFLPERSPRGKPSVTDIAHRTALIELATTTIAGLRVLNLASEQFTVADTLPELCDIFANTHLTFLMGSDIVRTLLYRWQDLDMLLNQASLAIGMRINDDPGEIATIMNRLEENYRLTIRHTYINTPNADAASSKIRNGSIDIARLHPAVSDYAIEHNLYTQNS